MAQNTHTRLILAVATTAVMLLTTAGPAAASVDDSFGTSSNIPSGCSNPNTPAAYAEFVDYGPGDPGNSANNDDYVTLTDMCGDGVGVQVNVGLNGVWLGGKYNGLGHGKTVYFDPFPNGNVKGGDGISLQVCSRNGPWAQAYNCAFYDSVSIDG
ncbi:hypothetical protein F4553_007901 [Allocatelliglobosispora scoriae]|uniref:Secreted protein n=1 Tax=Allocatelliglobosispora scoriae TaxID=643052 RepID=A0A841BZ91_9ACTN|nr:hypothetical protein [Allocatelliglobosispora scoriae]MBB5874467.1 hypothetical protein [Allocatelliglobosispora scoriae]